MNSCSEIYTSILLIRDNEISSRNKDSPPSTSRKVINLVKFFEREMTSLCFKNANDTRSSAPSPSLSVKSRSALASFGAIIYVEG